MDVTIATFRETKVALISHRGVPETEQETALKLVQWKLRNKLVDQAEHRNYGLHYNLGPPSTTSEHRVDFCLSISARVEPNEFGITESCIPSCRCACARDIGSQMNNQAVRFLMQEWLPESNEKLAGLPIIFHYVNVGPSVKEGEAITDVYLPLL